jgi:hypothetical protein
MARNEIPTRYRILIPATGHRGSSPEHAAAGVLPFGSADALPTTFSYTRERHTGADRVTWVKLKRRNLGLPPPSGLHWEKRQQAAAVQGLRRYLKPTLTTAPPSFGTL